ncbi:unnamed protein product, partial [Polarella glacialis]
EDPLQERGYVWYSFSILLPGLCMFTSFGMSLLTLPLVVQSWGLELGSVAYLKSVAEVSELLANFPASAALLRLGPRRAMLLGALLYAAVGLPLATAPNYPSLAVAYLLQGVVVKVYNRGQGALMKDIPKHRRGKVSGLLSTCKFAAMAFAPRLTAALLHPMGGAQHIFFVQVGLGVAMAALLCVPSRVPGKVALLGASATDKLAGCEETAKVGRDSAAELTYAALLQDTSCRRDLANTSGMCAFVSMLRGAANILLTVAGLSLGLPASTVALSLTVTFGVAFAFSFAAGAALDSLGRRPCAALSMGLFLVGFGGLGLIWCLPGASVVPMLMVSAGFLGAADSISSPLGFTLKGDAAARQEGRLQEQSLSKDAVKQQMAKFFAVLDVILDAVGIVYPIVLGLLATRGSTCLASFAFSGVAAAGVLWACFALV